MSYYGNSFPEINEVVYVTLSSRSEHGLYFKLVEYNNKEGFLMLSEIEKKIYYIRDKYFSYGKVYPMIVVDLEFDDDDDENSEDSCQNYKINLSHKKISADDRDKYIKYFQHISRIYRLTSEFSKLSNLMMKEILPLTMWRLMNKENLESSQETFKSILEKPKDFVEEARKIFPNESDDFLDNMMSRISSTTMIIHQDIELIAYCPNA